MNAIVAEAQLTPEQINALMAEAANLDASRSDGEDAQQEGEVFAVTEDDASHTI